MTPLFRRSLVCLALLPVLLTACQSTPPAADVRLPAVFSDHMVLQRGLPIQLWGTAAPGGRVTVRLSNLTVDALVEPDSQWHTTLPALDAGGPHELHVIGTDTTTFTDVLVGDVWVAGGQSNMEWPLRAVNDAEAEIAAADYPEIRLFSNAHDVAVRPLDDVESEGWQVATPETAPAFSAVGYFFGRMLHQELGIPIGILSINWGGTRAEAWMSREALAALDDFRPAAERLAAAESPEAFIAAEQRAYEENLAAWSARINVQDPAYSGDARWNDPAFSPADWRSMRVPGLWEDAGLPGYDGVVWFRRTFDLPAGLADEDMTLHLGQIDDIDSTWVNGRFVGATMQYSATRSYAVPADVLEPGPNTVTVRILDTGGGGGLIGDDLRLETVQETRAQPVRLDGTWQFRETVELDGAAAPPPPPRPQDIPSALYNAMLAPVIPYGIKGAIWYQGESNAGRAYQYRELFPALITDWRDRWNQGDFPFYFVQLANFMAAQSDPNENDPWPELREAQTMTLDLPNTGMAVTIDIGEADDIHPRNKQDVGKRLALQALAQTYGRDVVYSGPQYRSMEVEGDSVRLSFDHVGGGLTARGGDLRGFVIAGPDSQFVWANAEIEGTTVVVSSPQVDDPISVRYGWANNPDVTLYNAEGLPAVPFRTDDWPGVTIDAR